MRLMRADYEGKIVTAVNMKAARASRPDDGEFGFAEVGPRSLSFGAIDFFQTQTLGPRVCVQQPWLRHYSTLFRGT